MVFFLEVGLTPLTPVKGIGLHWVLTQSTQENTFGMNWSQTFSWMIRIDRKVEKFLCTLSHFVFKADLKYDRNPSVQKETGVVLVEIKCKVHGCTWVKRFDTFSSKYTHVSTEVINDSHPKGGQVHLLLAQQCVYKLGSTSEGFLSAHCLQTWKNHHCLWTIAVLFSGSPWDPGGPFFTARWGSD